MPVEGQIERHPIPLALYSETGIPHRWRPAEKLACLGYHLYILKYSFLRQKKELLNLFVRRHIMQNAGAFRSNGHEPLRASQPLFLKWGHLNWVASLRSRLTHTLWSVRDVSLHVAQKSPLRPCHPGCFISWCYLLIPRAVRFQTKYIWLPTAHLWNF